MMLTATYHDGAINHENEKSPAEELREWPQNPAGTKISMEEN